MPKNIENLEITDTIVEKQIRNREEIEYDFENEYISEEQADEYIENLKRGLNGIDEYEVVPLILDTDNIMHIELDKKAFEKGIKSISELCGKFVGLVTVGMSKEDAASLLISRETAKHNVELAKIQDIQSKITDETNGI